MFHIRASSAVEKSFSTGSPSRRVNYSNASIVRFDRILVKRVLSKYQFGRILVDFRLDLKGSTVGWEGVDRIGSGS
jgi:hypothetical protein